MKISVIITTFNEEAIIKKSLQNILKLKNIYEVIIVDGGSYDRTPQFIIEFLQNFQTDVVYKLYQEKNLSRGQGLQFGFKKSSGDILLFLHIDSHITQKNIVEIQRVISMGYDMGAFRLRFQYYPNKYIYSGIEIFVFLRSLIFKMFHGDQGMFMTRSFLETCNGYPTISLMEDVRLSQIGRKTAKLYHSSVNIYTDPRKIYRNGFLKMVFLYFYLKTLYYLKYDISYITQKYRALK